MRCPFDHEIGLNVAGTLVYYAPQTLEAKVGLDPHRCWAPHTREFVLPSMTDGMH